MQCNNTSFTTTPTKSRLQELEFEIRNYDMFY